MKRLEYRGYDSSGVGLITRSRDDKGTTITIVKKQGKVANLERAVKDSTLEATVGIAHTRWATHGPPNDVNAHPHCDAGHTVAVVHNGISENFVSLTAALQKEGCVVSCG